MHKESKMKYKISIVFTARNDNYGGDLIIRINLLLSSLIHITNKFRQEVELIIVEYNPPEEKEKLHEVLDIHNNNYLKIRFIEFPKAIHATFKNSRKVKLFEYTAKNIGIRRATNDFIISTNQDIIFTEAFFEFLFNGGLDKNKFYRTDRIDVNLDKSIFSKEIKQIFKYCKENAYLVKGINGDRFLRWYKPQSLLALLKNVLYTFKTRALSFVTKHSEEKLIAHSLHVYAAGDFLMMHRDAWHKARGYSESKEGNDFLDSLILFVANNLRLKQSLIDKPIYHIDHQMSKFGRPSMSLNSLIRKCNYMISTHKVIIENATNWGQFDQKLREVKINSLLSK